MTTEPIRGVTRERSAPCFHSRCGSPRWRERMRRDPLSAAGERGEACTAVQLRPTFALVECLLSSEDAPRPPLASLPVVAAALRDTGGAGVNTGCGGNAARV